MRQRVGHQRPLGSSTKIRFVEWKGERLPVIGDVALKSPVGGHPDDVKRAYKVVGYEEGRDRDHFKLILERVEYDIEPDDGCRTWWFTQSD